MRILTVVLATIMLAAAPAIAQTPKSPGKSDTAPGQTGKTPGQQQQKSDTKTGKDFAPVESEEAGRRQGP